MRRACRQHLRCIPGARHAAREAAAGPGCAGVQKTGAQRPVFLRTRQRGAGRTGKVDDCGAGVRLHPGVLEVIHEGHDGRQRLGVLLLLQASKHVGGGGGVDARQAFGGPHEGRAQWAQAAMTSRNDCPPAHTPAQARAGGRSRHGTGLTRARIDAACEPTRLQLGSEVGAQLTQCLTRGPPNLGVRVGRALHPAEQAGSQNGARSCLRGGWMAPPCGVHKSGGGQPLGTRAPARCKRRQALLSGRRPRRHQRAAGRLGREQTTQQAGQGGVGCVWGGCGVGGGGLGWGWGGADLEAQRGQRVGLLDKHLHAALGDLHARRAGRGREGPGAGRRGGWARARASQRPVMTAAALHPQAGPSPVPRSQGKWSPRAGGHALTSRCPRRGLQPQAQHTCYALAAKRLRAAPVQW